MADAPRPRDLRSTLAARRDRGGPVPDIPDVQPESPKSGPLAWVGRLLFLLAVLLLPWAFGGVYSSTQLSITWLLVAALVCWWVDLAASLRRTEFTPLLLLPLLCGLFLGIAQCLPLAEPTGKAAAPLQHEIYAAAYSSVAVDQEPVFSLSLDREATWSQLRLLVLALAGMILAAGLFQRREDVMLFLLAITTNGIALTFFALIQKVTWNGKIYWTWAPLFSSTAYGPFVNRNNAAGYLLLCLASAVGLLIYVWNNQQHVGPRPIISREMPIWRQWQQHLLLQVAEITASKLGCLFACGFLAFGIIATLSRGGVIALLSAGIFTIFMYGIARKPKTGGLLFAPVLIMVILLASWIGFFDELTARFEQARVDEVVAGDELDLRLESWTQSLRSRSSVGLFGSGLGTYPAISRMYNQQREIGVTEYAENQFVQSLVDGGWPALFLVVAGLLLTVYSALFLLFRGFSPATLATGGAGTFLVASQAIAGTFDFGWYIPANTVLGAALVGMVGYQSHYLAHRLKQVTALRLHLPRWFANLASLTAFALCVLVGVDLFSVARVDALWISQPAELTPQTYSLAQTDEQLGRYLALKSRRTATWFNKLGLLYLHRARLGYFEMLCAATPLETLSEDKRQPVRNNLWELTALPRMQEQAYRSEEEGGYAAARNFRSKPFFQDLGLAFECFVNSMRLKPAQPETLSRLSQLQFLFGQAESSEKLSDLANRLAPTNVGLQLASGMTRLYERRPVEAAPHFRRILELAPEEYNRVVVLLKGFTGRITTALDDRLIATEVLPTDPEILYRYATERLPADDPLRGELLTRANELLGDVLASNFKGLILKANILLALGDRAGGIRQLDAAVVSEPYNESNRFRLAQLLLEEGELLAAKKHVEQLLLINAKAAPYAELLKQVNELIELERSRPSSGPSS
ncbi:MAG: O-antigen ligase family protein [Planctomycetota bacterium]